MTRKPSCHTSDSHNFEVRELPEDSRGLAAALALERHKFEVLATHFPDGVSLVKKGGVLEYVNPIFVEIFGYTLKDISTEAELLKHARPLPQGGGRPYAGQDFENGKLNADTGGLRTLAFECKDGREKRVSFTSVNTAAGDRLVFYRETAPSPDTVCGRAAHDFNNILGAIVGYTELAQENFPRDSLGQQDLKKVLGACSLAKALLDRIPKLEEKGKTFSYSPGS